MAFEPLVYVLIFVGVLFIVEGIYLLLYGRTVSRETKVNRRLELLDGGADPEEVLNQLRRERERFATRSRLPLIGALSGHALRANIAFSPTGLAVTILGMAAIAFAALTVLTSAGLAVRVLVALVFGYGAVFLWLRAKAKKRISLFEEQFPDAVELIVRALRVGHPLSSAISVVASEMPDPLGTEFGLIADEATYGMEITESLEKLASRVEVHDLRFLAVAVSIQSRSGGNLAEILEGLAKVIRARFKLFRRVRAITAEARWSGWFLSLFPVMALLMVQLVRPDYYDAVQATPFFTPAALLVAALLAVNVVFMRMMVNIKV